MLLCVQYVGYNAAASKWEPILCVAMEGEIDSLHVAEAGAPDASGAQVTSLCLLFVAFTCPVPQVVDAVHYTDVPVGMMKCYDLLHMVPDASGAVGPRCTFPLLERSFAAHKESISAIDSSQPGPQLPLLVATASIDGTIKLWRPEFLPTAAAAPRWACQSYDSPLGHVRGVTALRFYGEGPALRLLSGSEDRTVKVWHIDPAQPPCNTLHAPFASPSGSQAAAQPAQQDAAFSTFGRVARQRAALAPSGSDFIVTCLDFIDAGGMPVLLVGYSDGHIRCWSMANPDAPQLLELPQTILNPDASAGNIRLTAMMVLDIPNNPNAVITGHSDGSIVVRDLIEAGLSSPAFTIAPGGGPQPGHTREVLDLFPAPGGSFVSGGADSKTLLWQVTPEEQTAATGGQGGAPGAAAF